PAQFDGFTDMIFGRITKATFLRYKIPSLLAGLDKVLYLDVDTLVNDSLDELYDTDLMDCYVGAVQEFYGAHIGSINAGMLLINTKLWREDGLEQKLFDITNEKGINDQVAINRICTGKIKYLGDKYNYQYENFHTNLVTTNPEYYKFPMKNPAIIHYVGVHKPWVAKAKLPNSWRYWKYFKMSPWREEYNPLVRLRQALQAGRWRLKKWLVLLIFKEFKLDKKV
ncbi:MAG: glycosyltransferase family 8 protein, partial [Deferribacteraceae bacterium]|nr:glycosyltransferase family 8 protein [Deferribacteraceae bacterium]